MPNQLVHFHQPTSHMFLFASNLPMVVIILKIVTLEFDELFNIIEKKKLRARRNRCDIDTCDNKSHFFSYLKKTDRQDDYRLDNK